MSLLAGERRRNEAVDERRGLLERVLAGADRDDVGVVVLAGELRGRDAPHQRRAHAAHLVGRDLLRSEEHTSELQSLMRISYAVFCLKKKTKHITNNNS